MARRDHSVRRRPSSFLAGSERPELEEIGFLLDQKIDGVVNALRKT